MKEQRAKEKAAKVAAAAAAASAGEAPAGPPAMKVVSRAVLEAARVEEYHQQQAALDEKRTAKRKQWEAEAEKAAEEAGAPASGAAMGSIMFMPKKEVVRRLRDRGEPATLFGEDDQERKNRLQEVLSKEVALDDMADAAGESLQNQMMKKASEDSLQANRQRLEQGKTPEQVAEEERDRVRETISEKQAALKARYEELSQMDVANEADKRVSRENLSFAVVCRYTLLFTEIVLFEWEVQNLKRPTEEKRSHQGKRDTTRYEETLSFLQPMIVGLKAERLNESLVRALMKIAFLAFQKEYVQAMEGYLGMAIGNSQWPLGVTQVRFPVCRVHIAHLTHLHTAGRYPFPCRARAYHAEQAGAHPQQ